MFTNIGRGLQWLDARRLHTLSEAAMMLLHLLLHVLIFHLLTAKGGQKDAAKANVQQVLPTQKDKNYVIKYIEKCPEKGYYFTHGYSQNKIEPDNCQLCFCQGENSAICWKRANRRCSDESFRHHVVRNRDTKPAQKKGNDTRIRRSPGFADIFFRDASRDVFNKNSQDKQCKPYESSFSDDCPPADWCTGCTVCDCDANGRWDCHILSFCSDPKKSKTSGRKMVKKKKVTDLPIGARPRTSMPIMNRRLSKRNQPHQKKVMKKSITKPKHIPQKKKPPLRYKRIAQKPKAPKSVFRKKQAATGKPVHVHRKKENKNNSNGVPVDAAKLMLKQMMSIVNKLVQKEIHNMTKLVARMQQWDRPRGKKKYMTTLTPRIIGGTRKRRQKREIETKLNTEMSETNLSQKNDKGELTSTEPNTRISTMSSSKTGLQEEKPIESTITDIKDNSIISNTKSTTVIPISTNTDSENDYYTYIMATNIIPLIKNKTNDIHSKKNIIITTDRTTLDVETITEHNKQTSTENANIITERTENASLFTETTVLPVTTEFFSALINPLKNTADVKTAANDSVDDIVLNYVPNSYKYLADVDPSRNDIKFNKWNQVKIAKENETATKSQTENVEKHIANETIVTKNIKYKISRKDVKRVTVSRKYHLLKTLNYYKCPFLNKLTVNETYMLGPSDQIPEVKNALTKILNEYNNTIKMPKKFKKFNLIKYLKKLFIYMFKRKNKTDRFSRYHILETLCEHFGPCKIKPKDKYLLRSKLTDLNHETMTIMKTVKIIKGLLILLDDSTGINQTSKKGNLGSAIQKLNSILKGNFDDYFKEPLTETKIIQIEYVKKNTQEFVKSVGKFATILNEIIAIITKDASKSKQNNNNKQKMGKDPFQNLKNLLVKYNLVQNNFMKKMYDLVNSFENKMNGKPKVSGVRGMNNSIAVDNFSRNILKNLRKLKHLAQTLNYNGRTKREIKDDDAIEYLLMLMEYLLKQNHPLDAAPVNDGIDLLLEAIRNAPDIKTVRKKVLINTPSASDTTVMAIPRNILYRSTTESFVSYPESDSDTASNEDSEKSKLKAYEEALETKVKENKDLFDIVNEEKDTVDKMQFDRRAGAILGLTDFTTDIPLINEVDNNTIANSLAAHKPTPLPQVADEEESAENSTNHASENENTYSDNPSNANNNYDDNTETVNVFSNTVNNNYDTNTGYGNNYDANAADGNIYMGNVEGNNHNDVNNDSYNFDTSKDIKAKDINVKGEYDSSNAVTEQNVPEKLDTVENLKGVKDSDEKVVTVYKGEIEEEDTTPGSVSGAEIEITTISSEVDITKNKHISKEVKTLDSYDTEKLDKKSKLEWIEENFRREYSHNDEEKGKAHEEKRDNMKAYTPVTIAPSKTSSPYIKSTNQNPILDVSMISNEVADVISKKKKSKINTEEVMFKKQMDLLNSLDYVTEKVEFDDTESKDGNADDKYTDTFPAYFV